MGKTFYLIGGWIAFALAMVGVVMPVMPTVPFLLVAVWCFSQSSPRLRNRILRNRQFGPPIRQWLRRGAIPTRIKAFTVLAMSCGVLVALWLALPIWLVAGQAMICAGVAAYVVTRPAA